MSERAYQIGLRALGTIGDVAPLDGLQTLVRAASEEFEVYAIPYQSIEALGEQAEGGDLEDAALLWCQGPEMADRRPLDLRGLAEAVLAGRVGALYPEPGVRLRILSEELSASQEGGHWPTLDLALVRAVEAWPHDFEALLREVHRGRP